MTQMSIREIESALHVAKDRTTVYQILSKQGIEAGGLGRSVSKLIADAVRDKDLSLGRILRAAKKRLDELENIS